MNNSRNLITRLRTRLALDRLSEADFVVAIAEIVSAAPEGIGAGDGLLLSQEIRELEKEWQKDCQRPTN